jgi:hypothetical protein
MDVGVTKSTKDHSIHFITGLVVVTVVFSVAMFAVRALIVA